MLFHFLNIHVTKNEKTLNFIALHDFDLAEQITELCCLFNLMLVAVSLPLLQPGHFLSVQ
jgi:hypothetical protein